MAQSRHRASRRRKHPDRDATVEKLEVTERRHASSIGNRAIGDFVRSRRTTEGLSQRALAELAGVGPRVVWELEAGKPTLRMDVVNAVLRVFGKALGVVDTLRPEGDE